MLNENSRKFVERLHDGWSRRWIGVGAAWVVAFVGALIVHFVPEKYEATAKIYVDTQTLLKPLMSGLTVQPDIDQQVGMLGRTLITRPNIEMLVRRVGIVSGESSGPRTNEVVERLLRDIKVARGGRDNLFSIAYRDVNPSTAEAVVSGLVDFFVESGISDKRRDTDDARKFIDEQIATYEKKLEDAENRLKDFKLRNLGFTVNSLGQDYFARMAAASDDLAKLRGDLRAAEQSRDALRQQLSGEAPVVTTPLAGASTPRISEIDSRLEAQRKQLDELLRRYTEDHPDVVNARRLVASLEAEKRADEDRSRLSPLQTTNANNPVFQQIKMQLSQAEANVASLRARVVDVQARYDQLRSIAGRAPQVEAEMAQLNRDYDVLRKNYEQLVARRESASMSGSVDASAKLTEFRVIEPPRVSPQPVFPQRRVLVPLVLVLAIASGIGAAVAAALVLPTVRDLAQLRELVESRHVLGIITLHASEPESRRQRRETWRFTAALSSLVAVFSVWFTVVMIHVGA